ncbi:hypothetical protein LC087_17745 [Bacillus carboniphilus]|uniref:Uncharacterized protein n=1 Tax=Bacillus carboniphilus TaxID=86663 RepID=A0ABY9JXZ1_9BACI|nr:hypothetical protein [Bacillus carboniphilus]WLR42511.1 hypothetical protein LC087_17745 [Bacillus carboniphilus]
MNSIISHYSPPVTSRKRGLNIKLAIHFIEFVHLNYALNSDEALF